MTVPSTARRAGPFSGNGVTTTFSFSFKTFAAGDLQVTRMDALGLETTLVLNSDYSVSLNVDQDTSPGGTITYPISGSPLPAGQKLTIIGDLDYEQTTDLLGGGSFNARVIEDTFDRTVIQIQQLEERLDRALLVPVNSTANVQLPNPEANELIGWDSTGSNLANYSLSQLATGIAYGTTRFDTFTGNGSTTQFALTEDPAALANLDVSISGVTQVPGTDYTLTSATLVFTTAPANGTTILARYGRALPVSGPVDSSAVTHVASGSGAVATTVQAKLREVVSVLDFGLSPNSVADQSTLFQNAINAAAAVGAQLEVPDGVFIVENLELKCDLIGTGTLKLAAAATNPLLILNGNDFVIDGITFDGDRSNQTATITNSIQGKATIALITNITQPTNPFPHNVINSICVQNCKFVNSLQVPIILYQSGFEFVHILGSVFKDCTQTAFYASCGFNAPTGSLPDANILISGCSFLSVGVPLYSGEERGDAIVIGQFNGVQIVSNFFKTVYRDALYFGAVTELLIQNNTFDSISWHAVQFTPSDLGTSGRTFSGGLTITGNVCRNLGINGTSVSCFVTLTGSNSDPDFVYDSVVIANNTVLDPGLFNIGVQVLSKKYQNVLITNNTIIGYYYGVEINNGSLDAGPNNIIISGNLISNSQLNGINLVGTDFVTDANRAIISIKNNHINDSGGLGILALKSTFKQLFISNNTIINSVGFAMSINLSTSDVSDGVINDNYCTNRILCTYANIRQFGNWSSSSNLTFSGLPYGFCRSGAGSPVGSVTPAFVGEDYLNTSGPTWFKSTGTSNTNWVALN